MEGGSYEMSAGQGEAGWGECLFNLAYSLFYPNFH